MLIDCIFLLFSPEQMAIQASGTRVLTAVEPPELLARMLPYPELREKVEIAATLLDKAKVLRITSPHGTDVTYKLNTYPAVTEYACTDIPGTLGPLARACRFHGRRRRRRGRPDRRRRATSCCRNSCTCANP